MDLNCFEKTNCTNSNENFEDYWRRCFKKNVIILPKLEKPIKMLTVSLATKSVYPI